MIPERQRALDQIVALARTHGLTQADLAGALEPSAASRAQPILFLAAVGGILVFSGIATFVRMFWSQMNSPARVVITLGSGFALFVMGLLAENDPQYRRAGTPLVVVAAFLQPTGLFVLAREYFDLSYDSNHTCLFVFGIMLLQQGLCYLATRRQPFLFFAIAFDALFFAAAFSLLGMSDEWNAAIVGLALLCLAYGLGRFDFRGMREFWLFVGAVSLLAGLFEVLQGTPVELAYLAVVCFVIFISTMTRSTVLMVVGVIAMLSYISYFTERHFVDSIGWPASLILLGLVFLGTGAGAVRLRKEYF